MTTPDKPEPLTVWIIADRWVGPPATDDGSLIFVRKSPRTIMDYAGCRADRVVFVDSPTPAVLDEIRKRVPLSQVEVHRLGTIRRGA